MIRQPVFAIWERCDDRRLVYPAEVEVRKEFGVGAYRNGDESIFTLKDEDAWRRGSQAIV